MAIKTKRFINNVKNCSCSMPGVWRAVAYCNGAVVIFIVQKLVRMLQELWI